MSIYVHVDRQRFTFNEGGRFLTIYWNWQLGLMRVWFKPRFWRAGAGFERVWWYRRG